MLELLLLTIAATSISGAGYWRYLKRTKKEVARRTYLLELNKRAAEAITTNDNPSLLLIATELKSLPDPDYRCVATSLINAWRSALLALPYNCDPAAFKNLAAMLERYVTLGLEKQVFDPETRCRYYEIICYSDLASGRKTYPASALDNGSISLNDGENFVFGLQNVPLIKDVPHRHYEGSYAGFNMRVMKGVSTRIGGSRGTSVTERSKEVVDQGSLIVTDQALLFCGSSITKRMPLSRLAQVAPFTESLHVSETNASPLQFVLTNAGFLATVIGLLKHPVAAVAA